MLEPSSKNNLKVFLLFQSQVWHAYDYIRNQPQSLGISQRYSSRITCFALGIIYMYFDSLAYYEPKFLGNREFYWKVITKYQDSLEVSNEMVGNSYDAFYTISKCSTKIDRDFLDTALRLHDLNKEREELKEKSDVLEKEIKLLIEAQIN